MTRTIANTQELNKMKIEFYLFMSLEMGCMVAVWSRKRLGCVGSRKEVMVAVGGSGWCR